MIFMHPEYKKVLDDALKKQAEDSAGYAHQMFLMNFGVDEVHS